MDTVRLGLVGRIYPIYTAGTGRTGRTVGTVALGFMSMLRALWGAEYECNTLRVIGKRDTPSQVPL